MPGAAKRRYDRTQTTQARERKITILRFRRMALAHYHRLTPTVAGWLAFGRKGAALGGGSEEGAVGSGRRGSPSTPVVVNVSSALTSSLLLGCRAGDTPLPPVLLQNNTRARKNRGKDNENNKTRSCVPSQFTLLFCQFGLLNKISSLL